jgi:hypothetical protein
MGLGTVRYSRVDYARVLEEKAGNVPSLVPLIRALRE